MEQGRLARSTAFQEERVVKSKAILLLTDFEALGSHPRDKATADIRDSECRSGHFNGKQHPRLQNNGKLNAKVF